MCFVVIVVDYYSPSSVPLFCVRPRSCGVFLFWCTLVWRWINELPECLVTVSARRKARAREVVEVVVVDWIFLAASFFGWCGMMWCGLDFEARTDSDARTPRFLVKLLLAFTCHEFEIVPAHSYTIAQLRASNYAQLSDSNSNIFTRTCAHPHYDHELQFSQLRQRSYNYSWKLHN